MDKTCKYCNVTKLTSDFYPNPRYSDGLQSACKACARRMLAASQLRPPRHETPDGTKRCTLCKETKPAAEFSRNKNFHDGLDRGCKTCRNARSSAYGKANRKRLSADQKRRYHKDPARFMEYDRKKLYGMQPGEYARMLAAQNGQCLICGTDDPSPRRCFAIDHCHETGKVRGILCTRCNTGLGHFKHSRSLLRMASEYLRRHD